MKPFYGVKAACKVLGVEPWYIYHLMSLGKLDASKKPARSKYLSQADMAQVKKLDRLRKRPKVRENLRKLKCAYCGKRFEKYVGPGTFKKQKRFCCSKKCKSAAEVKRVKKRCRHCRKMFGVAPSIVEKRQYCSVKCQQAYHTRRIKCAICGKIVQKPRCQIDRSEKHYCSIHCRGLGMRKKVRFKCRQCGKVSEKHPNVVLNQVCCSRKCAGKLRRKQVRLKCRCCRKVFYVRRSLSKQKYCSRRCFFCVRRKVKKR